MASNEQNERTSRSILHDLFLLGIGILVINFSAMLGALVTVYASFRVAQTAFAGIKANIKGNTYRSRGNWDYRKMPLGMRETKRVSRNESFFQAAGIKNLIKAKSGLLNSEFSFIIRDDKMALSLKDMLDRDGITGINVYHGKHGYAEVSSNDASLICKAAEYAFPPRQFSLKRTVETVSEYLVTGCSSREEAEEKCREGKGAYLGSYVNVLDEVNGEKKDETLGSSFSEHLSLEQGSYIVQMTERNVYAKDMAMPQIIDENGFELPEEFYIEEAFSQFTEDKTTCQPAECTVVPEVSCRKDCSIGRFIERAGSKTRILSKDSPELDRPDVCMVYRFDNYKAFIDCVLGDRPLQDKMVLMKPKSDVVPAREGEYVLTLPADLDLMSSLRMSERMVDRVMRDYGHTGITREEVHLSSVIDELDQNGYVSAKLSESPDLTNACVNGVPLVDVFDRFIDSSARMSSIEPVGSVDKWISDASLITGVEMYADKKSMEMVLRTTISKPEGPQIIENRKPLDAHQMENLFANDYTVSELKDLSMQMNPGMFGSYRYSDGSAMITDPVLPFLGRTAPSVAADNTQQAKEQVQESVQKSEKKKSEKKRKGLSKGK